VNPWLALLVGIVIGDIARAAMLHVAPRRGVPSPAQRVKLLAARERALSQREQEWTQWAMWVSGLACAKSIDLPPMPGTPGWGIPHVRQPSGAEPLAPGE
jgi:hypothetical protein